MLINIAAKIMLLIEIIVWNTDLPHVTEIQNSMTRATIEMIKYTMSIYQGHSKSKFDTS